MKKLFFIWIVIAMVCFPYIAEACPMCQGGEGFTKNSIFAYKATTAFLAALPLLMAGGIFYWIRRKFKRANAT